VNRLLDVIQEEFAGDPWYSMRACYDGFQWALGAGNIELASSMMKSAIHNKILCEGDYPEDKLSTWRRWAANPLLKLSGAPAS